MQEIAKSEKNKTNGTPYSVKAEGMSLHQIWSPARAPLMVVGPGLPTPLTLESPAMKISTIARRLGGRSRTIHHDDVGIAAEGENSPYLEDPLCSLIL